MAWQKKRLLAPEQLVELIAGHAIKLKSRRTSPQAAKEQFAAAVAIGIYRVNQLQAAGDVEMAVVSNLRKKLLQLAAAIQQRDNRAINFDHGCRSGRCRSRPPAGDDDDFRVVIVEKIEGTNSNFFPIAAAENQLPGTRIIARGA